MDASVGGERVRPFSTSFPIVSDNREARRRIPGPVRARLLSFHVPHACSGKASVTLILLPVSLPGLPPGR